MAIKFKKIITAARKVQKKVVQKKQKPPTPKKVSASLFRPRPITPGIKIKPSPPKPVGGITIKPGVPPPPPKIYGGSGFVTYRATPSVTVAPPTADVVTPEPQLYTGTGYVTKKPGVIIQPPEPPKPVGGITIKPGIESTIPYGYGIDTGIPTPEGVVGGFADPTMLRREKVRREQEESIEAGFRKVYEEAGPIEQIGLQAHTLFSERGWELLGSYMPGAKRTASDVTYEQFREAATFKETYPFEYGLTTTVKSPPFQAALLYGGTVGVGTAISVFPRVATALTSTKGIAAGTVLTGLYVGTEGVTAARYFAGGEIAKGWGKIFQIGTTFAAAGKGFTTGMKYGTLKFGIPRSARGLYKEGVISLEQMKTIISGTKVAYDLPKMRLISELEGIRTTAPAKTQAEVLAAARGQKARITGSLAQEAQLPDPRLVLDIDIGLPKGGLKAPLKQAAGKGVKLDIHGEEELMKGFLWGEKAVTTPAGTRITTLREQFFRKLSGSIDPERLARKGGKEISDVYRIMASFGRGDTGRGLPFELEMPSFGKGIGVGKDSGYSYFPRKPPTISPLPSMSKIGPSYPSTKGFGYSFISAPSKIAPSRISAAPSAVSVMPSISPIGKAPSRISFKPLKMSLMPSRRPSKRPSRVPYLGAGISQPPRGIPSGYLSAMPKKMMPSRIYYGLRRKPSKGKKKKGRIPGGRKFKYTPSLIGITRGITAFKAPKRITGFGIRPILKKRKKRR